MLHALASFSSRRSLALATSSDLPRSCASSLPLNRVSGIRRRGRGRRGRGGRGFPWNDGWRLATR
eukprot:1944106-Rhodomonas_salina.1